MSPMGHSLLPFSSLACSSSGKWASMPAQAEESLGACMRSRSKSLGLRCCVRIAVMFVGLHRQRISKRKLQHPLNVSFLLVVFIFRQVIFYVVEISSSNEESLKEIGFLILPIYSTKILPLETFHKRIAVLFQNIAVEIFWVLFLVGRLNSLTLASSNTVTLIGKKKKVLLGFNLHMAYRCTE